jgi:hypothetical protein
VRHDHHSRARALLRAPHRAAVADVSVDAATAVASASAAAAATAVAVVAGSKDEEGPEE